MKPIYLLACLFVFNNVFSQSTVTLTGKVSDKLTGEPLAYVNFYLANTSFGTTTNQSGEFVFRIPFTYADKNIVISYLGYKPVEIKPEDVTEDYLIIALEPSLFQLDEIIVRPIDPLDIVYKSIENITQNYNSNSYIVQGFQREYVTSDTLFIQLLEVAFQTKGKNDSHFSTVIDARFIEDKREKAPLWNTSRGGFYTFGWSTISGIETPLQNKFLGVELKKRGDLAKYYEFESKESIRLENREIYVIAFDQKRNVRKSLLKGMLYIDSESYAIVKLIYELSPRGLKALKSHRTWGGKKLSRPPKKIDVKKDRSEITFRKYGDKWYLNSLIMDTEFDASLIFFRMVQSQKNSLKFHSERTITAIDTSHVSDLKGNTNIAEIGSIPTLQNYIKRDFENYDVTNDEKWVNFNFIKSDTSIAQIVKQLKAKNQQWEKDIRLRSSEKAIAGHYTSRQIVEDLDYLKETLEKVHPGLNWYSDQESLDKKFDLIKDNLNKKNSEVEFFRMVSQLIEQIHCGHTEVYPSLSASEYQTMYGRLFPWDLWIKDDSAIVIKDYDNISKKSRVIAINGYEIDQIIEQIKSNIPSDGFNQTYKEFRLQREFPALFSQYFQPKDTFDIKVQDSENQIKSVKILGVVDEDNINKSKYATFQTYDSLQTLMLTIPSFSTDQEFPAFLKEAFNEIEKKEIKNLIIDLRNNQGGRDEYGALLYSYLVDSPFEYYKNITVASVDTSFMARLSFGDVPFNIALPDYVSQIQERNGSYFYTFHPNLGAQPSKQNPFKGNVYIVINGGTFSAAAEFASIAHANNRAIFIGEEAGGGYYGNCSLGTPIITLPNSRIRISIPLAKYELAVTQNVAVGNGVIPGNKTTYYLKDILNNRDKDLELCFKMIGESLK